MNFLQEVTGRTSFLESSTELVKRAMELFEMEEIKDDFLGKMKKDLQFLAREWNRRFLNPSRTRELYDKIIEKIDDLLDKYSFHPLVRLFSQKIANEFEEEMYILDLPDDRPDILIAAVTKDRPLMIKYLLESLIKELEAHGYKGYNVKPKDEWDHVTVVYLESSDEPRNRRMNQKTINGFKEKGIKIYYLPIEKVERVLKKIGFDEVLFTSDKTGITHGIGKGRMCLTLSLNILIKRKFSERKIVTWIMDDDKEFNTFILNHEEKYEKAHVYNMFHKIDYFKKKYPDMRVGIGEDTYSPPLPASSTIRVHLHDLYWNLKKMKTMDPDSDYQAIVSKDNYAHPDYYYDLSMRSKKQFDVYFPWIPRNNAEYMVKDAFVDYLTSFQGIFDGIPITRPLVVYPEKPRDVKPTIIRGGNTLFYDNKFIFEMPYYYIVLDNIITRRSDMIWSILTQYASGCKVYGIPLHVYHSRFLENKPLKVKIDRLKRDMLSDYFGAVLYRAIKELFEKHVGSFESGVTINNLDFVWRISESEIISIYKKHKEKRWQLLIETLENISLLIKNIKDLITDENAWWNNIKDAGVTHAKKLLLNVLERLNEYLPLTKEKMDALKPLLMELTQEEKENMLEFFKIMPIQYIAWQKIIQKISQASIDEIT